jgi:hypothetical protein
MISTQNQIEKRKMCGMDNSSIPHNKTNSKFILKMYDKNLLQSNGDFKNGEIPILWDF